jgi:hypothetical protein
MWIVGIILATRNTATLSNRILIIVVICHLRVFHLSVLADSVLHKLKEWRQGSSKKWAVCGKGFLTSNPPLDFAELWSANKKSGSGRAALICTYR